MLYSALLSIRSADPILLLDPIQSSIIFHQIQQLVDNLELYPSPISNSITPMKLHFSLKFHLAYNLPTWLNQFNLPRHILRKLAHDSSVSAVIIAWSVRDRRLIPQVLFVFSSRKQLQTPSLPPFIFLKFFLRFSLNPSPPLYFPQVKPRVFKKWNYGICEEFGYFNFILSYIFFLCSSVDWSPKGYP